MSLKSAVITTLALTLGGVFAAAQTQPTPINHASEARRHIDQGAIGTRTKKSPQAFSGAIHQSLATGDQGLKGSPQRPQVQMPGENGKTAETAVTMKALHKAKFLDVNSPAVRSLQSSGPTAKLQSDVMDPRAYLVTPIDGTIVAPVQMFAWTKGTGVTAYGLWVGSCYDCVDILDEYEGTNTSQTVNLPDDGRIIYATLFSYVSGAWYWVDYEFTASGPVTPAALTSPGNGATLNYTQNFTWNTGYNVLDYQMTIGNCFECGDILNEDEGTNTSRTVNLPTDGRTIFVTLYSFGNDGNWYWYDYQFRAMSESTVQTYTVNIKNDYLYSINIFVDGTLMGSVNPNNTQYVNLNASTMNMSFELVQPTLNGKVLGDTVAGYWNTLTNPSGTYNFEAGYQLGSSFYFLPQISNNTSAPLEIEVNGGLQAENKCNCEAPAYTQNVRAGYYELFSNSNVRLFFGNSNYIGSYMYFGTDSNGNVSPSGPLYKLVQVPSGLLALAADQLP